MTPNISPAPTPTSTATPDPYDDLEAALKDQSDPYIALEQAANPSGSNPVDMAMASNASDEIEALKGAGSKLIAASPIGSAETIINGLEGKSNPSSLQYGLSAADLASLGLLPLVGAADEPIASALAKYASRAPGTTAQFLGAGAGSALGAQAADKLSGGNSLAEIPAALAGGIAGGAALNPQNTEEALDPVLKRLMELGAKPTAAQMAPNALTKSLDLSSRISGLPWVGGALQNSDESMQNAVRALAQQNFGSDILSPHAPATGQALANILEDMKSARTAQYQPALQALGSIQGSDQLGPALIKAAQDAVNPESMVNANSQKFIEALQQNLAGRTTPLAIDKGLTGVKSSFQNLLGTQALDNQAGSDYKSLMAAVNNAYYNALNGMGPEGSNLGNVVRDAKLDYAENTGAMSPLAQVIQRMGNKPEGMGASLLGQGSEGIKSLLDSADPITRQALQAQLARSILAGAASGPDGGISAKAFAAALTKNKNILPLLGDAGDKLSELQKALQISNIGNLQTLNPPGSGVLAGKAMDAGGWLGALGEVARGNPDLLYGMAGKGAADTLYSRFGPALVNAANRIPPAALPEAALGTYQQRQPITAQALSAMLAQ